MYKQERKDEILQDFQEYQTDQNRSIDWEAEDTDVIVLNQALDDREKEVQKFLSGPME